MSVNSETIFNTETHPGDSSAQTREGAQFRGDGFYNRADGLHTVQWTLTEFIGTVSMQATLAVSPTEVDWFNVPLGNNVGFAIDAVGNITRILTTEVTYDEETTGTFSYNFIGNYVWVRARINNWTSGVVNSIRMSH